MCKKKTGGMYCMDMFMFKFVKKKINVNSDSR